MRDGSPWNRRMSKVQRSPSAFPRPRHKRHEQDPHRGRRIERAVRLSRPSWQRRPRGGHRAKGGDGPGTADDRLVRTGRHGRLPAGDGRSGGTAARQGAAAHPAGDRDDRPRDDADGHRGNQAGGIRLPLEAVRPGRDARRHREGAGKQPLDPQPGRARSGDDRRRWTATR